MRLIRETVPIKVGEIYMKFTENLGKYEELLQKTKDQIEALNTLKEAQLIKKEVLAKLLEPKYAELMKNFTTAQILECVLEKGPVRKQSLLTEIL